MSKDCGWMVEGKKEKRKEKGDIFKSAREEFFCQVLFLIRTKMW